VCSAGQLCNLQLGKCQGGEQCKLPNGADKQCSGGPTCAPEDGECKCGGRGGAICKPATATTAAEVCVLPEGGEPSCSAPCDPLASRCETGTYCYFNAALATPASYCTAPTGNVKEDQFCSGAIDCFDEQKRLPMHCAGYDPANEQNFGKCRPYCDPRVPDHRQARLQFPKAQCCVAVDAEKFPGIGFCQPNQG